VNVEDLVAFAARALAGHRLRTALSLLGVAIGVVAVVGLTSLGEGARAYVTREFATLGTNLLIVLPGKVETTGVAPLVGGVPHDLTVADAEAIARRVRDVRRVAPLAVGTATAGAGGRRRDVTVVGTTAAFLAVRHLHLQSGRYLPEAGAEAEGAFCVLGAKLVTELFAGRNPLGEMVRIGDERFRVIGVLAPRGVSLGMDLDEVVHVPVARHLKLFNRRGLFRILVEVHAHERLEAARRAIVRLLTERHDGEEDVTVLTQDAVLSAFSRVLAILTAVIAGIGAISLAVAGIGIMNVMLVSVAERTREIGLLKAIGATPGQILRVFLLEAALLSTAGGLAGLGLAWALTTLAGTLWPAFPIAPPVWAVWAAIGVAVAVGLLFGSLPARRAARLDPVVALAGGRR
jgi:putative ABC transport system permease protein